MRTGGPSGAPARPRSRPGRAAALLVAAALVLGSCAGPGVEFESTRLTRGAVVSEHPEATKVGLDVLERGGNAADAAVATALALAVVYPQAGNLGGGGFALWVPEDGEPRAIDFREAAPAEADAAHYVDEQGAFVPQRSLAGPLSVAVPGSPAGLHRLWREAGSGGFSFAELVRPAIRLARDGFYVDPWLAEDLSEERVQARMNAPARELFYPEGRPLRAGELLQQPALARTLERLAEQGPDGFYRGVVASAIVAELGRTPVPGAGPPRAGFVRLEDLRTYEPRVVDPLVGWFRGYELLTMPPPSSGGLVVLQVLAILEGLPLEAERERAAAERLPLTERMAHWWIEALRRAFADRAAHMGDPAFHDVPVEELLSPRWIAERRVSIGERANPEVGAWVPPPPSEGTDTTHLSVIDRSGNAVSMTTTLNATFGSGILVAEAGFFLNDEMDDFSIVAGAPNLFGLVGGDANALAPGKRPLSSMSPTVVREPSGTVRLVLGSPGGPRIITSVVQVLLRALVLDQDLRAAIDAPRLHQQWQPTRTLLEPQAWPEELRAGLERRGHELRVVDWRFGSVQGIQVARDGEPTAYSDPRRGGAGGTEGRGIDLPARPKR